VPDWTKGDEEEIISKIKSQRSKTQIKDKKIRMGILKKTVENLVSSPFRKGRKRGFLPVIPAPYQVRGKLQLESRGGRNNSLRGILN
jgi:hypothetical protein